MLKKNKSVIEHKWLPHRLSYVLCGLRWLIWEFASNTNRPGGRTWGGAAGKIEAEPPGNLQWWSLCYKDHWSWDAQCHSCGKLMYGYYVWHTAIAERARCEDHGLYRANLKRQSLFTLPLRRPCWNSTHVSFLHCSRFVCKARFSVACTVPTRGQSHLCLHLAVRPWESSWPSLSLVIITTRHKTLACWAPAVSQWGLRLTHSPLSLPCLFPWFQMGLITLHKVVVTVLWMNGRRCFEQIFHKTVFLSTRKSDKALPANILLSGGMNKT